jgi:virginiamycin B lyase
VNEYDIPTTDALPHAIAAGPDGAKWFTENLAGALGRVDRAGGMTETRVPGTSPDPTAIAVGPDGIWFTERFADLLGRLAPDGTIDTFDTPSAAAGPTGIGLGPDGALWFTERAAHRIGRVTADGTVSELPVIAGSPGPTDITLGPDGAMWFTEQRASAIGRVTMQGDITEFPVGLVGAAPSGIVAGPDGALWFGLRAAGSIGRMSTDGSVTVYPVPTVGADPSGIAVGADGALWFTEPSTDIVGRITTDGAITEYQLPNVGASPFGIAAGPDGAIWFTEGGGNRIGGNRIGRIVEVPTDTTAPAIDITAPARGAVVTTGSPLIADFVCADEPGGSGLASCAGTVDDGAAVATDPGAHVFEVTAADVAGNTSHASTGYLAFSSLSGSVAAGSERAGMWASLETGMGTTRLPKDVGGVLAAGYPLMQEVSCADPSVTLGAPIAADARSMTRLSDLVVRWRTERAWAGTCRTLTLRFVTPGWTGVDAAFLVRFPAEAAAKR